jgi:ABC-2 type transport system ATP-binding protein
MIEVTSLTKRYGAVDDLSFTVRPGIVTGFLGPNGAGKSTTVRMILGLDNPSQGRATVNPKFVLRFMGTRGIAGEPDRPSDAAVER